MEAKGLTLILGIGVCEHVCAFAAQRKKVSCGFSVSVGLCVHARASVALGPSSSPSSPHSQLVLPPHRPAPRLLFGTFPGVNFISSARCVAHQCLQDIIVRETPSCKMD